MPLRFMSMLDKWFREWRLSDLDVQNTIKYCSWPEACRDLFSASEVSTHVSCSTTKCPRREAGRWRHLTLFNRHPWNSLKKSKLKINGIFENEILDLEFSLSSVQSVEQNVLTKPVSFKISRSLLLASKRLETAYSFKNTALYCSAKRFDKACSFKNIAFFSLSSKCVQHNTSNNCRRYCPVDLFVMNWVTNFACFRW